MIYPKERGKMLLGPAPGSNIGPRAKERAEMLPKAKVSLGSGLGEEDQQQLNKSRIIFEISNQQCSNFFKPNENCSETSGGLLLRRPPL